MPPLKLLRRRPCLPKDTWYRVYYRLLRYLLSKNTNKIKKFKGRQKLAISLILILITIVGEILVVDAHHTLISVEAGLKVKKLGNVVKLDKKTLYCPL